jgi:hypothetical protein
MIYPYGHGKAGGKVFGLPACSCFDEAETKPSHLESCAFLSPTGKGNFSTPKASCNVCCIASPYGLFVNEEEIWNRTTL